VQASALAQERQQRAVSARLAQRVRPALGSAAVQGSALAWVPQLEQRAAVEPQLVPLAELAVVTGVLPWA